MSEPTSVANGRSEPLWLAAMGGLGFTVLYLLHRIGQGFGPADSALATIAAYQQEHRGMLLASEVAVGLALLVFILLPAGLVPVLWKAGQESIAVALGIACTLFITLGFTSIAAETALANATDESSAVLALNQLQGRVPVVWAFTALAAVIGWAILRTGLVWQWFGWVSLGAAVFFLLGSVFSLLGPTAEGQSSNYGIAVSILWTLGLGIALVAKSKSR